MADGPTTTSWTDGELAAIGRSLAAIDALDPGERGGPEPADITLATFGMPIPEA